MINKLALKTSIKTACDSLGIARSSYYYWKKPASKSTNKVNRKLPDFAYSEKKRDHILSVMNSDKYMDCTPYEIYNSELDNGKYLCSVSTMYRILRANDQVFERRKIRRTNNYQKPELLASKPNQVWSWDITKLKGAKKWTYFYLYVILDIYSRYVVGWMVAYRERAQLAKEFLRTTLNRQNIKEGELVIHADRGSSMRSKPVALLLSDLGVTKSHSRPYISNDNPFSESQFKTLKYRPEFPNKFFSMEEARSFNRNFFKWYNSKHYHSGLNFLTPESVHYGYADEILKNRKYVLSKAFKENPKRFRYKKPVLKYLPKSVWINKPDYIVKSKDKINVNKLNY